MGQFFTSIWSAVSYPPAAAAGPGASAALPSRSVPAAAVAALWLGDGSRHDDSGGADIDDYWWHELRASSETESHSQHHPPAVPASSNSGELSPDRDNV
jgi:hypothetical protein